MQRYLPTLSFTVKVILPVLYWAVLGCMWWWSDVILVNWLPQIAFERPWWLALFVFMPLLWIFSLDSLSGLGPARSMMALGIRTLVIGLVVIALAEVQWVQRSEKMTVIYLLDQSLSIPPQQRRAMVEYVVADVKKHRNADRSDRAGVIVFGREAKVEIPPFNADVEGLAEIEGYIDLNVDATNLAGALKQAQAIFPEDSAKRVVVVSDGNENLGSAQAIADQMAASGLGIDVVPVPIGSLAEVAIEKVTIPTDVRKGQPFDIRVVLNNLTTPSKDHNGVVRGKLKLIRRTGERDETIEQIVEIPPGKKVFTITQEIDNPDFYTYLAEFEPERPGIDDAMTQNNRASAFTHVRGKGNVLLIEDAENPGEFDFLLERLKALNLEVTLMRSDRLFSSLAELQKYDTVVLANCPRSSGDDNVTSFSDAQISMLVRNTQQMGAGLVMIGGRNAFGAGGWTNTELEKAMPVDFQIQNAKVVPVGALVLTMHASEMADGNHWQKVIAQEAIKALGPQDYCGVVQLDGATGRDGWLWNQPSGMARVGASRDQMMARVARMVPGDMPDFDPSLLMAAAAFSSLQDAAAKHMIIISDGDPTPPRPGTIQAIIRSGAKVTTVAIGTHQAAGSTPLQGIATATGGKYYVVTDPRALPRIYQREARRVARPLVYEKEEGFRPQVVYDHEITRGVGDVGQALAPITGFVLTQRKENPLVEVSIVSPEPAGKDNNTILASWTYGLGRTVAFTSDGGKRWATPWTGWDKYDKLFGNMVRWSMRPVNEEGKFSVAMDNRNGKVRVVVTALDQNDEFLNFLDFTTSVVGPDMKPFDVEVSQVAPGRYVGEFDANEAGSYFVNLTPGPGKAPIRTGVNVPYSPEFLDRETNTTLLANMAKLKPAGGEAGAVIEGDLSRGRIDDKLLATDTFRHNLAKAVSSQPIWPYVIVLAGLAFFGDVLIRRVTMGFGWAMPYLLWMRQRVFGGDIQPADERISRLKSKKAEIAEAIDERRAQTRFEPMPDAPVDPSILTGDTGAPPVRETRPTSETQMTPEQEMETYTQRLLKAKNKMKKDKPGES